MTKKIAFFVINDNFIDDIINNLSSKYTTKKILFKKDSDSDLKKWMEWADICWFEWCNKPLVYGSNMGVARKKKIVCRLHSYEAFTIYLKQINWQNVDRLIFVADHIRNIVLNKIDIETEKTVVIPNGIDVSKYKYKKRNKGYNLAYVGYINYTKGPMLLLHAFKAIHEKDKRYKLYIAGEYKEERYLLYFKQMIKEMGLENNVFFEGWQKDVNEWLNDKHYVICTSVLESQNLGIMEAMVKGIKPLIHNFVRARGIYPERYIWNTFDELYKLIIAESYDSEEYRDYIKDNYSLGDQLIKIEKTLLEDKKNYSKNDQEPGLKKTNSLIMAASYGSGNIGDEMIGFALNNSIVAGNVDKVMCLNQTLANSFIKNVKFYKHCDLNSVKDGIDKSTGLLFGGGGLFYDFGDIKLTAIRYRLFMAAYALLNKKPLYLLNVGACHIKLNLNKKILKNIFDYADFISVRDSKSLKDLKNIGVANNIMLSADNVFSLYPAFKKYHSFKKRKIMGIHLRPICELVYKNKEKDNQVYKKMAEFIDYFIENEGYKVRFFSLLFKHDDTAYKKIISFSKNASFIEKINNKNIDNFLKKLAECQFFVGMSLHSLIFSSMLHLPFIGLNYHPKVKTFCEELNHDRYCLEYPDFKAEALKELGLKVKEENIKFKEVINKKYKLCMTSYQKLNQSVKESYKYQDFKIVNKETLKFLEDNGLMKN